MDHARRPIAVVTGANRGLGLEVVRQLASRDVRVVLTARDPLKGGAAAAELAAQGLPVAFHPLDVEDRRSVGELRQFLDRRHGRVDVLVNNAGAHPHGEGAGVDVAPSTMSESFQLNCLGALQVTQELLPLLRRSGSGRIVNVSTMLALTSQMHLLAGSFFAYRVAKAALNAVTVGLATELRDQGITINAVHPGWLRTAMGGPGATDSVEGGARAVVHVALDAPADVTGRLFLQDALAPW